jgi:hypothetical protein
MVVNMVLLQHVCVVLCEVHQNFTEPHAEAQ